MLRYAYMTAARTRLISKKRRYELGLVARPHYAYGLLRAAQEARQLGYSSITAIEFGVAGGNGLVTMEEYAEDIGRSEGVKIRVVGFDSGSGLPAPTDYRDAPYLWAHGDFSMDEARLRSRLTRAELVLGDVRDTASDFVSTLDAETPIGFVAFDLDFWSSTLNAFDVFRGDSSACLPRVWCYFDDIVGMPDDIGVPLSISNFNSETHGRKIRHPYMLRDNIPFRPSWAGQMFQAYFFDHERFNDMLASPSDRELPLD